MNRARFDYRPIALAVILFALYARAPELFTRPRMWAEDAYVFLKYSHHHGFWETLFFALRGAAGYVSFHATLPAAIAGRVPLEYAPWVTTYFTLGGWMLLFTAILYGHTSPWPTPVRRLAACACALGCLSLADELWINTINFQSVVALILVCVLLQDPTRRTRLQGRLHRVAVVFGGLAGLYFAPLIPAFAKKALDTKDRETVVQLAILCSCAMIQGLTMLAWGRLLGTPHNRFVGIATAKRVLSLFQFQLVEPLTAEFGGHRLVEWAGLSPTLFLDGRSMTFYDATLIFPACIAVVVTAVTLALLCFRNRDSSQSWLLLALVGQWAFVSVGALGGVTRGRYMVVPAFILLVMFLNASRDRKAGATTMASRFRPAVCTVVLACSLCLYGYKYVKESNRSIYTEDTPVWADEIRVWRNDPDHMISFFPDPPGWHMYLPNAQYVREIDRALGGMDGMQADPGESLSFAHESLERIPREFDLYATLHFDRPVDSVKASIRLRGLRRQYGDRFARIDIQDGGRRATLSFHPRVTVRPGSGSMPPPFPGKAAPSGPVILEWNIRTTPSTHVTITNVHLSAEDVRARFRSD